MFSVCGLCTLYLSTRFSASQADILFLSKADKRSLASGTRKKVGDRS